MSLGLWTIAYILEAQFGQEKCGRVTPSFISPESRPAAKSSVTPRISSRFKDSSYDCVLASHCLEHIANPLLALAEWKRVLKNDGLLLLILPHKDGTFDWRRPTTPLAHMIEDYEDAVGEEDMTHLPEILELHDLSRDIPAGTKDQFEQRCLANHINRAMHHHVFDTMAAVAIVNHIGLEILCVDNLKPSHIIVLASRTDQPIDNREFIGDAKHWRRSPFPSDHKYRNS